MTILPTLLAFAALAQSAPTTTPTTKPPPTPGPALVTVDRDDVLVTESCQLAFAATPIADLNGNGVVQITGDNITVDLGGTTLMGADASTPQDAFEGIGIVVTGKNVTLRKGSVRGFRCGVLAQGSDGSTFEDLTLSDNYAMRLRSTVTAEDGADWLWPHENDGREWVTRYGAGLCVERSNSVTVRDITVRRTQNGILLDRVNKSQIYDNDCSFLSGWGLALWRSSDNMICRNSLDFCVRGYSHGVYNRGQDSAGILMFEQCSNNTVALNSATHCGDGFFGFAGKEALGEKPLKDAPAEFHKSRGCNNNIIVGNDFSFAAAHGLEMTFSFGNVIGRNRFEGNGICGIWGGYSRDTKIAFNTFAKNGGTKDVGEGGAIDIEHGARNVIDSNEFSDEGVAVDLWWDDDKGLLETPWAKANGAASEDSMIVRNVFTRCAKGIGLRQSDRTIVLNNQWKDTATQVDADAKSELVKVPNSGDPSSKKVGPPPTIPTAQELAATLPGLKNPIGGRAALGGREAITMTAIGPWDGKGVLLALENARPNVATWRVHGTDKITGAEVAGGGPLLLRVNLKEFKVTVDSEMAGSVMPYYLRVRHDGKATFANGCIFSADWRVTFFPSVVDPRTDLAAWRERATSVDSVVIDTTAINFDFGNNGPSSLKLTGLAGETLKDSKLPSDGFGTIASTTVKFPKGTFTFRLTSDDGVRLIVDGKTLIEDWTWHPSKTIKATMTFEEPKSVDMTIEHFELDGAANLSLFIDGEVEESRRAVFGK